LQKLHEDQLPLRPPVADLLLKGKGAEFLKTVHEKYAKRDCAYHLTEGMLSVVSVAEKDCKRFVEEVNKGLAVKELSVSIRPLLPVSFKVSMFM
jgi:hypothetical protein